MITLEEKDYLFFDEEKQFSFKGYNLIMPDVSVGNVGQLAVDLLLNNLEVKAIGRISHPCFLPFVGVDPFHPENSRLVSSCEIYECQKKKLVIIQIRTRIFTGRKMEFRNLIVDFIRKFNFKLTILVASSFSEFFTAEQLQGVPLHYLCTSKFSDEKILKKLLWKVFSLPDNADKEDISHIPGSFITHTLIEKCEEEKIPLVSLIFVCSEGNNYPEALQMVHSLNSWLNLKEEKDSKENWKMPVSWNLPYGCDAPHTIY